MCTDVLCHVCVGLTCAAFVPNTRSVHTVDGGHIVIRGGLRVAAWFAAGTGALWLPATHFGLINMSNAQLVTPLMSCHE